MGFPGTHGNPPGSVPDKHRHEEEEEAKESFYISGPCGFCHVDHDRTLVLHLKHNTNSSPKYAISNIKLQILKKEEYDIWAMEMEHYLEYMTMKLWKVIPNGNSKEEEFQRKGWVVRVLSPVSAAEIQAIEKKGGNIFCMSHPKEHMRDSWNG
ncbi:hypothetical protein Tco_0194398 [Tanacetum coccineum]